MTRSWGCVVLTQGRRPQLLAAALGGLLAQRDVDLDVVVVRNGGDPVDLPEGVRAVVLPDNVGIPAGRNAGVPHVRGDLLLFLDDDAQPGSADLLARLGALFDGEPDVGLVQPRVVDPDGRPAPRRWVPRLRVGDPARSSDVTAVWEGLVAVRRDAFARAGGWPGEFWYAHEGIDLAWGVWDAGYRVRYAGGLTVLHEANDPGRHPELHRLSARNRVWLARRRLPLPLAVLYPSAWLLLTLLRTRRAADLREVLRGTLAGLTKRPEVRHPMTWCTVWRMTRAGRPPLL